MQMSIHTYFETKNYEIIPKYLKTKFETSFMTTINKESIYKDIASHALNIINVVFIDKNLIIGQICYDYIVGIINIRNHWITLTYEFNNVFVEVYTCLPNMIINMTYEQDDIIRKQIHKKTEAAICIQKYFRGWCIRRFIIFLKPVSVQQSKKPRLCKFIVSRRE